MNALEQAGYLAYAQSKAHKLKLEEAKGCISAALSLVKKSYVAWSGGKDSSAMLYLIAQENPFVSVRVLTAGETRIIHPDFDDLLGWWVEKFPNLDFQEVCLDYVFADDYKHIDFWTQCIMLADPYQAAFNPERSFDGVFLGLRTEESKRRRMALNKFRLKTTPYAIHQYSQSRKDGMEGTYRFAPLARWKIADIAAIHLAYDIPLLDTYKKDGIAARTHLRVGRTSLAMGHLEQLKRHNLAGYTAMIERFPELQKFA